MKRLLAAALNTALWPVVALFDHFARTGDDGLADCPVCGDASTHTHINLTETP